MYFDPAPKKRREDLFNFESEFLQLTDALRSRYDRLVIVRGLRRTGKTSLMKVAVNETRVRHIWLDGRGFESRNEFFNAFFGQLGGLGKIGLEGFSFYGVKFTLKSSAEELLRKQKGLVIVLDEAQYLLPLGIDKFLAYLYDNFDVKVIISGSQIGVLDRFVGKGNAKAPLYGRAMSEIKMRQLSKDEGIRFLIEGGRGAGKNIDVIEAGKIVNELDGIIGWLTLYGYERLRSSSPKALEKAIAIGKKLAEDEFNSFLISRKAKKKYTEIMRVLAMGNASWGEIKGKLSKKFGYEIPDTQLSLYLSSLADYSFIEKKDKYSIPDPLLQKIFY